MIWTFQSKQNFFSFMSLLCTSPELVKLWTSCWYFGREGLHEWGWIYSSLLVICTAHVSSIMVTTQSPSFIKTQMRKLYCRPVFTPAVCCFRDGQCSTMLAQKRCCMNIHRLYMILYISMYNVILYKTSQLILCSFETSVKQFFICDRCVCFCMVWMDV